MELEALLKERKVDELVGTFQAGTIPIVLDVLARDTSDDGKAIVADLFELIEKLKKYYSNRLEAEEESSDTSSEDDEIAVPVSTTPE